MSARRMRLVPSSIDPVGANRFSIMCAHCHRSAVVVARTSAAAWLLFAADGWRRSPAPKSQLCCPECANRAS